jgi:hypothetical protein
MSEAGAVVSPPSLGDALVVLSSVPLELLLESSLPQAVAPRARIPIVRMDANFLLRRKTPPHAHGPPAADRVNGIGSGVL